ncbi:hypothetical protein ACS0TY_023922 [Phlomoides rotata]
MDLAFENLSLLEEEENEDGLVIDQCSVGGTGTSSDVELCVVGRILTEQYVNFGIMKARLASIWKSKKDIFMKEVRGGRILFQFYHSLDVKRVVDGSPWFFDNNPLVLH